MTHSPAHTCLHRILDALETDLLAVSDAELTEVLDELGMKPEMKGSLALIDMMYRWSNLFEGANAITEARENTPTLQPLPRRIDP